MKTHPSSANQLYKDRTKQTELNLKILKRLLKKHAQNQKKTPDDYGCAGSLGYANEKLTEIINFLGGDEIRLMHNGTLLYPVKKHGKTIYVTVPE
jgi:hypothetical protein